MFFSLAGIDSETMVLDHESAPAYYLLYKEGTEPKDFVECTDEMEEQLAASMKKSPFAVNRTNKVLLIAIFCAAVVLGLYLSALLMKIF